MSSRKFLSVIICFALSADPLAQASSRFANSRIYFTNPDQQNFFLAEALSPRQTFVGHLFGIIHAWKEISQEALRRIRKISTSGKMFGRKSEPDSEGGAYRPPGLRAEWESNVLPQLVARHGEFAELAAEV